MFLVLSAGLLMGIGARPCRAQQTPGSIRGVVTDKEFDAPVAGVAVSIAETRQKTVTTDQGSYVIAGVPPGRYTLVFAKDGYLRQVKAEVLVNAGALTDLDVALAGEFEELEEYVVQDNLQLGGNTEAGLLQLRLESPALMDAISADLISRAGAGDAASALRLVAGATVQNGKTAVVRGLPDRYVSSQINGVRVPSANEDKRAVELDQFPSAIIEAIQVSKTFTPDQQGDASGGAVNVRLKSIPNEPFFLRFSSEISFNSQVAGEKKFLSYDGGGVDFFGIEDDRDEQLDLLGMPWEGAVGVSTEDAPFADHKWSFSTGGRHDVGGLTIGGMVSLFYERDSAFFDDGIDDSYWVETPGGPMTPRKIQQTAPEEFKTSLFDVTQGRRSVQWGGLATLGLEIENHSLGFSYLYSRTTDDIATLAKDTRGKEFFFPGYDPNEMDPNQPGFNGHDQPDAAPYIRLETLEYTERSTGSFQIDGHHRLPFAPHGVEGLFAVEAVELDWILAFSFADQHQPDKRQFGSTWVPDQDLGGGFILPAVYRAYKPAANFTFGNLQRIWKDIEEDSDQYHVDFKVPFRQWTDTEGYLKLGFFYDKVDRSFDQNTYSNFNDNSFYNAQFDQYWSAAFPFETPGHPIYQSTFDVDYEGEQRIRAWYAMMDLPITPWLSLIGGARLESTDIGIVNFPGGDATWFPPGSATGVELNPGDADVSFSEELVLPAFALEIKPLDGLTLRGSYAETVARQTFKELTPILQQEYLGGPIFIGNPDLQMARLDNYDLRVDWTPVPGTFLSASYFYKDVTDAIEYVQRIASFNFTTASNYPEGKLSGFELEVRQELGHLWEPLAGLSVGANATFIDSEVTLPDDEQAGFNLPEIMAPMETRDMTNAPEHLFNFHITYDVESTGTSIALFYTLTGDTLIAGAGQDTGHFVPSLYATEFDTLNLNVRQRIGEHINLQFQAKNLTNADIETVYRSNSIGSDVKHTSHTDGIEFSLTLSADFRF